MEYVKMLMMQWMWISHKNNCFSAIVFSLKIKITIAAVVAVDDDVDGDDDVNHSNDDIDKGN